MRGYNRILHQKKMVYQTILIILIFLTCPLLLTKAIEDNNEERTKVVKNVDSSGISWQKNIPIDYQDGRNLLVQNIVIKSDETGNLHLVYRVTVNVYIGGEQINWQEIHYQKYDKVKQVWEARTIITGNESDQLSKYGLNMIIDEEGRLHIVWMEYDITFHNSPKMIYYQYLEGGIWSEKILVENETAEAKSVLKLIKKENRMIFFWLKAAEFDSSDFLLNTKSYDLTTKEWGEKVTFNNILLTTTDYAVAIDSKEKILIAYVGDFEELDACKIFYVYEEEHQLQKVIPKILCHFDNKSETAISAEFDSKDNIHVAWQRHQAEEIGYYAIYYARIIQEKRVLTMKLADQYLYQEVKIVIDEQDTAHLVWVNLNEGLFYKQITITGEISRTEQLIANDYVFSLTVTSTGSDNLHLFYTTSIFGDTGIFYMRGIMETAIDRYGPIILGIILGGIIIGGASILIRRRSMRKREERSHEINQ
ncbi:MAG: hypothetical protein FK734_12560 [Asgard group archaeon]|nr:hypothetical protein [Asgard group archaeon]